MEKDSARRQANADFLHAELNKIPGIGTQKPGRCATMQSYYVYCITVAPDALKEGKTRDDVIAALAAEGVTLFTGWGAVAYKQRLWNVSPERYRVESFETVENIIANKVMMADLRWLNGERELCEKFVEAFHKVMGAYGK